MWITPEALVAQLQQQDWTHANAALCDAVSERDVAWLAATTDLLSAAADPRLKHTRDQVFEALALVPGAVRTLAAHAPDGYFAVTPRNHPDQGARRLAGRLGQHQPIEALSASLWMAERPIWRQVLTCWIQEAVIRGHDLRGDAALSAFWASLDHPLAALPLYPLPLESCPPSRPHRYTPASASGWGGPPLLMPDAPRLPEGGEPPEAQEVTTRRQRAQISACFESARAVSNGRSDAAVFRLSAPVDGLSRRLLASLRLRCFSDDYTGKSKAVAAQKALDAQPVDAQAIFTLLLAEAADGGCYNMGWSGAWGRRDAWRSLAGLTGLRAGRPLEAIAEAAASCQWAFFKIPSEWFWGIMRDPAVACLRPDRQTVAVFAGTDSD